MLHSKYILKKKRDNKGKVQGYRATFVVRVNQEQENDVVRISSTPDFKAIRVILCLVKKRCWHARHFDFQNAFSNRNVDRSLYVEMPKYIYEFEKRAQNVLKLYKSLYSFFDAARIRHDLVTSKLKAFRLN